jgi:dephospho-CoA kinase
MKLAFVGHAAVGKDTLSDYASIKLSIANVSSGDLIREYVRTHNLGGLDRENLIKVGNELRAVHGGDYLVRLALEKHPTNLIISGLRTVDEVMTFKNAGGIIIAVTASAERRYELGQIRNRIGDNVTFAEWMRSQEGELLNTDHKKQNVDAVIAFADYHIENLGTLDELYQECDEVLKKIQAESSLTL